MKLKHTLLELLMQYSGMNLDCMHESRSILFVYTPWPQLLAAPDAPSCIPPPPPRARARFTMDTQS